MSFLHPEFLYYLLPPLFILFGLLLTQKTSQETYFSPEVMDKLRVSANTLTLRARNALFFIIGILMVIALAGPVINDGKVEVKAKSADIMIALDISDSMLGEDVYPNRLKLAKQKALTLLKLAPEERVGVIAFAQNSYLVSPLSFDSAAVGFLLRSLNTNSITEKGTNFLSMLKVVDKSIHKDSKKYLLILSDGGDKKEFSKEIAFAKEKNIAVFILGMGTPKGAPIKKEDGSFIRQNGEVIVSKLNENIASLATKTGGVYIKNVNSDDDIKAMLHEIEMHSKKKELKSQEITKHIPLFYYPLGLALLLLLIATSSMSKRVRVSMPNLFVLGVVLSLSLNLKAGVLDFAQLEDAKKAYLQKDYATAQKLYSDYEAKSNKAQTNYNIGNALYKQGKYKEAIKAYDKSVFMDKNKRAKNFANLGNAYVKSGQKGALEDAVRAYEESLKLHEDKDTRENLEAVKKALQKQKKQNKNNKQNKDNKKNKKNKEKKNKQNKKEQEKNKKNSDNKDGKSKDKEKSSKNKNKSDKKSEDQKKQEQNNSEKKKNAEKKKKSEQNKKKDTTKELQDNNQTAAAPQVQNMKNKMSEDEEKKWLKQLNKQQSTYLYRLNENNKFKENSDEKPW